MFLFFVYSKNVILIFYFFNDASTLVILPQQLYKMFFFVKKCHTSIIHVYFHVKTMKAIHHKIREPQIKTDHKIISQFKCKAVETGKPRLISFLERGLT